MPPAPPPRPTVLVAGPDLASSRALCALLTTLGLDGQPVSNAEAAQHADRSDRPLVLVDGALFEALAREHGAALARGGASDAEGTLPDPEAFLARTTQVLAAAQPPNEQVAVLVVHFALPSAEAPQRATIRAELVRRLRACVRERDALAPAVRPGLGASVAQLGDEEFTILLPSLPRTHVAFKVAQRLYERFVAPIELESGTAAPACTIGIALAPGDAREATTLLELARSARCAVQREPGTGIRFFTPAMNTAALQRLTLETALRTALERGELLVQYQPKVQIATGRIVGAEALVRWRHPELGMVPPGQFIPIAEETGQITAIGEFVLETACRESRRWQDAGLPPVRMAVNLSTIQLRETRLLETLQRVLAETGLAGDLLELEITESILLHNAESVVRVLQQIKQLGVHLSIDDFGTGYSSLAYLKRFPIDSLKIDQAFVRDLATNPDDAAITTSIILMGKSLKLDVIAEGVETRSQLALLHVLECDEAQGFLFSKAIDGADFVALLAKGIDPALVPRSIG